MTVDWKKKLLPNLPYLLFVYLFDKLCQAVRLAPGLDASEKFLHLSQGFTEAFSSGLPSLVLQNDVGNRYAPTLIVATVTSRTEKKKYQPTHVLIAHNTAFEKPSVVQLEQIFTIDKSRIQRFLGQTTRHEMRRIEEALMNSLEINEWDRRNADE